MDTFRDNPGQKFVVQLENSPCFHHGPCSMTSGSFFKTCPPPPLIRSCFKGGHFEHTDSRLYEERGWNGEIVKK